MVKPRHKIQALTLDDVPAVAQLCGDAFETDRQTEMKALGKEPFDMKKYTLESLPGLLKNPRIVVLKVVDDESGDVMGYCTWGFRGFPPDDMPVLEGRTQPPDDHRHLGLVVDDKEAVRRALKELDVEVLPGRGLDFRDPWGNRWQVVEYANVQFTKAPNVLRGMGLERLRKNERALRELDSKGMRPN